MSRRWRRVWGIAAVLAASVLVVPVVALRAASSAAARVCGPSVGLTRPVSTLDESVPVVFVHGWTASAIQFTDKTKAGHSLVRAVEALGAEAVRVAVFNYGDAADKAVSNEWVTDPRLGPRLARAVDCLARLSEEQGGRGKVIVVGHSLGGLVARYAVAHPAVGTRRVGLVVTIATPHKGVAGADLVALWERIDFDVADVLMDPARIAAELPTLEASGVDPFYIGGRLKVARVNLFGRDVELRLRTESDILNLGVPIESAIPTQPNSPAETYFICENSLTDCFHTTILGAPQVRDAATKAIRRWLENHPLPAPEAPSTTALRPQPTTTTRAATPPASSPDFTAFAGEWSAHSAGLTVRADGTGEFVYRNYVETPLGPDFSEVVTFRLSKIDRAAVEGTIETSSDPEIYQPGGRIRIDYLEGGVVSISPPSRASTLCSPAAYSDTTCGA